MHYSFQDAEKLKKLVIDPSCMPLIEALCAKDATIKATVTAPSMIAELATPDTAGIALSLIETFEIAVDDELSGVLLAKDNKGKSKVLELMAKSFGAPATGNHGFQTCAHPPL